LKSNFDVNFKLLTSFLNIVKSIKLQYFLNLTALFKYIKYLRIKSVISAKIGQLLIYAYVLSQK